MTKKISNPFSTGGGGGHFESHIQATFVTLMLTGGRAPGLRSWPIVEICLQGRIHGFHTDDLIVYVENPMTRERRKLLGQVKHSIDFTESCSELKEVLAAAWADFNNAKLFTQKKDIIALITGPISALDTNNVQFLLNHSRQTATAEEFMLHVTTGRFSPLKAEEKLKVFRTHLKRAKGSDVTDTELYQFLRHFYLFGFDLGKESGVALALLHSHIAQFKLLDPGAVWAQIVETVQTCNQAAGTLTPQNLPDDLIEKFQTQPEYKMPADFIPQEEVTPVASWQREAEYEHLPLLVLVGAWQDSSSCDQAIISSLLNMDYPSAQAVLGRMLDWSDSPLSFKNGIWKIRERDKFLTDYGSQYFDRHIDAYQTNAIKVLSEHDPAFDLDADMRMFSNFHGQAQQYSIILRQGMAEGLAMLGNRDQVLTRCTPGKAVNTCKRIVRDLLKSADWCRWGSLNRVMPLLAEASPSEFLNEIEWALRQIPTPFEALFNEESFGYGAGHHLTGTLWGLEGIAWEEQYLQRVCLILGALDELDPGGPLSNRPVNSLVTILLPWKPQTLATPERRAIALRTLIAEHPDTAWKVLLRLLPGAQRTTSGSHKPTWRNVGVSLEDLPVLKAVFKQESAAMAALAVEAAQNNSDWSLDLVDSLGRLPEPTLSNYISTLFTRTIPNLTDVNRRKLWEKLLLITRKHRNYSDAPWALSGEKIAELDSVISQLSPVEPIEKYAPVFNHNAYDLIDQTSSSQSPSDALTEKRIEAVTLIFEQHGLEGIIKLAASVTFPHEVGYTFAWIAKNAQDNALLPKYLDSTDEACVSFITSYIIRRHLDLTWSWSDGIDKSNWTPKELGTFLAAHPFDVETWSRVEKWLGDYEEEYWTRTRYVALKVAPEWKLAIQKLAQYDRVYDALDASSRMLRQKVPLEPQLYVALLKQALKVEQPPSQLTAHNIASLLLYLQEQLAPDSDELAFLEFGFLTLLVDNGEGKPLTLERKLSTDPAFFCEAISMLYRPDTETQCTEDGSNDDVSESHDSEAKTEQMQRVWELLYNWATPPGVQPDGSINSKQLNDWVDKVTNLARETGHLSTAMEEAGRVLYFAPEDPDGLWINKDIASILNIKDETGEHLRTGFKRAARGARGWHVVEYTGEQELELAMMFRNKAEALENKGFVRLAAAMLQIAEEYETEAEAMRQRELS
ncbi:hypothetical protein [Shewanella algae]|uniref:hypothetical protein n=1 Tax=Shewanella algae TaxID=38313 RepID=UPI0012DF7347|nr:hypothetical protein [Shewanella algae]QGS60573.1 hypothetical protein GMX02_14285 [Shewanella algae]